MNQRAYFLKHMAQTSAFPLALEIEKAEGVYLYDTKGKAILDLIAGISVSSVGHRHPKVQAAVQAQVEKYWHTLVYGEFVLSPQVALAKCLAAHLPSTLNSVYFVNSGTEATEGAMKLAKRVTGRTRFVSMQQAYHGSTQGAMSLNSDPYYTQAFRPLLPDVHHIRFNNFADLEKIDCRVAAVFAETVQAESGIVRPVEGYLTALRNRCYETGTLLIFDEIQAGMGRTGTLWAFENYGVIPDVLLLAKGLGGGMPIGAFIADRSHMETLSHDPILGHITTFGGHPVSCAAALATLELMTETPLLSTVQEKEALFLELLKHPKIRAVRSAGLWLAVEVESFEFLQKIIEKCLEKGLLTDWFLFNNKSLRIAPPLTITETEIRWACRIILETLDEIA
jgi:acetylornithine/succinyldiaminopimelate/putrescine aminotransferase